jgi:DNA-binding PadR family transcriptional regulator
MVNALRKKIDDKSAEFLQTIEYYGGEATKSEIRAHTGMNHNEASYRFKKLEELGLIEVTKADAGNGVRNPRVAHLTDKARSEISKGLFGTSEVDEEPDSTEVVVDEAEIRAMKDDIQKLRQRQNVVTQTRQTGAGGSNESAVSDEVRERVEGLEQRFARLESETSGDGVTPKQVAEAPAMKTIEKRVGELEADFEELEEYVYEWNSSASTFMTALRKMVESELGVSMDSYLENAK